MKLYLRFMGIHFRSSMEYKASFFMLGIATMIASLGGLLSLTFLFMRFHTIAGYTFSQVLLCFSTIVMSFALSEVFFRGFDRFEQIIRGGTFDRMLLRPCSLIGQILFEKIEFNRLSKVIEAAVVLAYAIPRSGVIWTADKILVLIFMILGGVMMFAGMFLLFAGICFYTLEGLEVLNILTNGSENFGHYPVSVYGKWMLRFYTFIVPLACVQYYPLQYLLGRSDRSWYGLLPLAGFVFTIPCYCFWRFGLKHYKSNGS